MQAWALSLTFMAFLAACSSADTPARDTGVDLAPERAPATDTGVTAADAVAVDPLVARAGTEQITRSEAFQELNRLSPILRSEFDKSRFGRAEFLNALAERRLLAREARRRGLDKRPEFLAAVRRSEEALLIDALIDDHLAGASEDAAAKAFYDRHRSAYTTDPTIRVERIIVPVKYDASPRDRRAARERVERAAAALRRGDAWSKLRERGGERRSDAGKSWTARREIKPSWLRAAALGLKEDGQVSEVVETRTGVGVLRLVAQRPGSLVPFETVRDRITEGLAADGRKSAFELLIRRLRRQSPVEVHADRMVEQK